MLYHQNTSLKYHLPKIYIVTLNSLQIRYHEGSWFSHIAGNLCESMTLQGSSETPLTATRHGRGMTWTADRALVWKGLRSGDSRLSKHGNERSRALGGLTYTHDLRRKHLPLARLAAGSHGDAGRWVPDHTSLDWPVHGTGGGGAGDSHGTLWCPIPRWHSGPGSVTANHACRQAKENWAAVTASILSSLNPRWSYSVRGNHPVTHSQPNG